MNIDEWTRWTNLREVGNLWAVKLTVLIPVIGYLVLFNSNIVEYLRLSSEVTSAPFQLDTNEIGFRLLCIYFGLCAIAAASILYTIFCPEEIKLHRNAPAYIDAEKENTGSAMLSVMESVLRDNDPSSLEWISMIDPLMRPMDSPLDRKIDALRKNSTDLMDLYYDYMNESRPRIRITIASIFLLGFGLLAIPSVEVFYKCLLLLVALLF